MRGPWCCGNARGNLPLLLPSCIMINKTNNGWKKRQIRFEGDIALFVSQVALVQFTLIKNTVEIYNNCFDYRLASALVHWAKEHINSYIELVDRQLQTVEPGSKVWENCIELTKIHSTMLVECGLDFKELRNPVAKLGRRRQEQAVGLGLKSS
jgi:hypothetical protein